MQKTRNSVIFTTILLMLSIMLIITACAKGKDINIKPGATDSQDPAATPGMETNGPDTMEPDESIPHQIPSEEEETPPPDPRPSGTSAPQSPYYIKVDVVAQLVTVYKKDSNGKYTIPYKVFLTSTGKEGNETPLGKYKIYARYEWCRMVDNSYGQFAVRFNGPILFHSITYDKKSHDSFKWYEYNKLGYPASLGCVRLTVVDAKWIYDNCPNGTVVEVYKGQPQPELWEKLRQQLKIPLPPDTNWDPTDPHPKNPIRLEDLPDPSPSPSPMPTDIESPWPTGGTETLLPDETYITESPSETPAATESHAEASTPLETETPENTETIEPTDTATDAAEFT